MLFGEVVNGETPYGGEMILNPAGEMIVRWWLEWPDKFPNVNVDIFMLGQTCVSAPIARITPRAREYFPAIGAETWLRPYGGPRLKFAPMRHYRK